MANWWLEDRNGVFHKAHFTPLTADDVKSMSAATGWSKGVLWVRELNKNGNLVYKLLDAHSKTIQGAISMYDNGDHVFIDFIESAPHNRQPPRAYVNVAKLLIAFAGKRSVEIGAEGFIALTPKEGLIGYYTKEFKAFPIYRRNLGIADIVTKHWIRVYYR